MFVWGSGASSQLSSIAGLKDAFYPIEVPPPRFGPAGQPFIFIHES